VVLRDHLPEVFQNVRRKFPKLRITLREGSQAELEALLQAEEVDLAVTVIEKKTAPGIKSLAMVELPLVLLVEKGSAVSAPEQLWRSDKIDETLICLPPIEAMCKNFQQGLRRLGVDWFPGIEVSSIDLVETYAASGFGIGLSVLVPRAKAPPNLRVMPLAAFPPIAVGALWRGKSSAVLQAFLEEFQNRAKRLT
jgi:DNA-binding transcriptional LysR family regulator